MRFDKYNHNHINLVDDYYLVYMIINFIYNSLYNNIDLSKMFKDIPKDITLNIFDTSYTKEAKKGRVVLNKYAAHQLPFFELTDDDGNMLDFAYTEQDVIDNKLIKDKVTKHY